METITKEVVLAKKTHDVGMEVVDLVKTLKEKLHDGFQITEDAIPIATKLVETFSEVFDDVQLIDDEFMEDPIATTQAATQIGMELLKVLLSKED